jgi:hypothetical protein
MGKFGNYLQVYETKTIYGKHFIVTTDGDWISNRIY